MMGGEFRLFSDATKELTQAMRLGGGKKGQVEVVEPPTKLEKAMKLALADEWDFGTITMLTELFKNEADASNYLTWKTCEQRMSWVNMKMMMTHQGP